MPVTDLPDDFQNGKVLLFDKELTWTSFDIVNKVRILLKKYLGIKKIKVGHAGTLDPLASGLVIVCTGKETKKIEDYLNLEKEYVASLKLGETTPSFDLETEVDNTYHTGHINESLLVDALNKFIGEFDQVPPQFSAKYVNGIRAYELARKGKDIKLKPNRVKIVSIEILSFNMPFVELKIVCSKGTYIRALARDLGEILKCGAHLSQLRRTRIGDFRVDKAYLIKDFEKTLKKSVTI